MIKNILSYNKRKYFIAFISFIFFGLTILLTFYHLSIDDITFCQPTSYDETNSVCQFGVDAPSSSHVCGADSGSNCLEPNSMSGDNIKACLETRFAAYKANLRILDQHIEEYNEIATNADSHYCLQNYIITTKIRPIQYKLGYDLRRLNKLSETYYHSHFRNRLSPDQTDVYDYNTSTVRANFVYDEQLRLIEKSNSIATLINKGVCNTLCPSQ